MPLLCIPKDYILRGNRQHFLERLADLDIDSALPPTDRVPRDRDELLNELGRIEVEFDRLGAHEWERDVVLMAEARWEFDSEDQ